MKGPEPPRLVAVSRRIVLVALLMASLLPVVPVAAQPPLVLLVPYPAGALSDIVARAVAPPLARVLERATIVENQGGAAGTVAARRVLGHAFDGGPLLQGSPNELILAPTALPGVGFVPRDFRMVQIIGSAPLVLVARADLPAASLAELIALAQEQTLERPLRYGSVGTGSLYHLLANRLAQRIEAPMVHVPYKGGAPMVQDLVRGIIDFAFQPANGPTLALADAGRLKLLGTLEASQDYSDDSRLGLLPRLGGDPRLEGFEFSIWSGYFVPAGVPDEVAGKFNEALARALQDGDVQRQLQAQGVRLWPAMSLDEARAFYHREIERYRDLARP